MRARSGRNATATTSVASATTQSEPPPTTTPSATVIADVGAEEQHVSDT